MNIQIDSEKIRQTVNEICKVKLWLRNKEEQEFYKKYHRIAGARYGFLWLHKQSEDESLEAFKERMNRNNDYVLDKEKFGLDNWLWRDSTRRLASDNQHLQEMVTLCKAAPE